MSNPIIGPVKGVVHRFQLQTFGDGAEARQSYQMTVQVTDEDAIKRIRDSVASLVKEKNVIYNELQYPPVQSAEESSVDGVSEGLIIHSRYRVDASHLSPFTLDGKNYVDPDQNHDLERLCQTVGRVVKFAVRFTATPPMASSTEINGKVVRRANPAGNVYCALIAVVPLNEIIEVGTTIETIDWGLDADSVVDVSPTLPEQPADAGDFADEKAIPF